MFFSGNFINNYWWLLVAIILMDIGGYYINGYCGYYIIGY